MLSKLKESTALLLDKILNQRLVKGFLESEYTLDKSSSELERSYPKEFISKSVNILVEIEKPGIEASSILLAK